MWRATKRLLVDCIQYGVRCIQPDLNDEEVDDDVSDYEDDDVSGKKKNMNILRYNKNFYQYEITYKFAIFIFIVNISSSVN